MVAIERSVSTPEEGGMYPAIAEVLDALGYEFQGRWFVAEALPGVSMYRNLERRECSRRKESCTLSAAQTHDRHKLLARG